MTIDEMTLREAFPDIPWDEPVLVTVTGQHRWVCRYCVAMHGLRGAEVIGLERPRAEYAYIAREEALAHVEKNHHE